MNKPLISIITPSYNAPFLLETYQSIVEQTYTHWEWLITDDASLPEYQQQLAELSAKDARIRVFYSETNQGAGAARNNSIEQAKGQFIAFIDSDDLWLPEKLEKQLTFMQQNDLALSYTAYQKFTAEAGDLGVVIPPLTTHYNEYLKSNIIACSTGMYDVEKLGKCLMPLIRKRQDFGLWLSIIKKIETAKMEGQHIGGVAGLPDVLMKYRIGSGMSQNKLEILTWQWKFYREVVGLNVIKSSYYFMYYAVRGFIKARK